MMSPWICHSCRSCPPLHWDHNAHYHRWLLARLPRNSARALDVGCGTGALAALLARRVDQVDAVDRSAAMIATARREHRDVDVRWIEGDVLDPELPLTDYDAITAVASLHHLPLEPALRRLRELLRPGGVLVVVGLSEPGDAIDVAWALLAVLPNAAVGAWRAIRSRNESRQQNSATPLADPTNTYDEIRAAAAEILPGVRFRRGLYWRYLLVWTAPPAAAAPPAADAPGS